MKNDLKIIRLLLFGLFLSSLIASPFLLDVTLITRFTCLSAFVLVGFYLVYSRSQNMEIKVDGVVFSYAAYVLVCGCSLFWAQNKSEAIFEISKRVLCFFVFLLTVYCLSKRPVFFMDGLFKIAILLSFIAFSAGCYQYFGLKHTRGFTVYAISGINGHKNLYASFLFLNLFFLIGAARKLSGNWKFVSGIAIVLSLATLVFLRTKAVWLGLAVTGVLYPLLYLYGKKGAKLKINFGVALTLLLIIANAFFLFILPKMLDSTIALSEQVNTKNAGSPVFNNEQERLILWKKTYQFSEHYKLFGVGAGNWQIHFPDAGLSGLYRAEDLNYTFQRPHNDFLWILSETGIVGLDLFLLFLFTLLLLLIKALKNPANTNLPVDLILATAFITGYFVISFFDFPKERIEHGIWINMLCGIAYYQAHLHTPLRRLFPLALTRMRYRITMAVLVLVCITGLMRYKGEYYTRRLYDAKNSNQPGQVIEAGNSAWSAFYTLDPTSVPVKWYVANADATMKNYFDAQECFLEAYSENPYNRNVINDLASSYAFNQNTTLAKKYYREASRISPRFDDPKLNLATLYIQEKNFKAADSCLKTLFHDSERRSKYQRIVDMNVTQP